MYKCCRCGYLFEYPKTIQEPQGEYWGVPAYESWEVCPSCGYDEFDEEGDEDCEEDE